MLLYIIQPDNSFHFSVCIKFLTKLRKTLTTEEEGDISLIETKLKQACKKAKKNENRFVSTIISEKS